MNSIHWTGKIAIIMALALPNTVISAADVSPGKGERLFGTAKDAAIPVIDGKPWPSKIEGFKAVEPSEHPRLLFRKSDIPMLREKAKTPEGQAILKRLRWTLDGANGETPTPKERWTISTVAGWGFLYVITGEKKYAELGKQAQDLAYAKTQDYTDTRYGFSCPDGALRAGPAIGYGVLGYDLCFDGWDEDYRKKFAEYISKYNTGSNRSLPELARGSRHHPASNHWGLQVGGAALALMGIMNDPGADMTVITPLLETSQKAMIRNMTEGFGDGGQFNEGNGEGSMSSHIVFFPALQAWKVAFGLDYYNPRPNAQWMAMKWFFQTVPQPGMKTMNEMFWPLRCGVQGRKGYSHNNWKYMHAYFAHSFGLATDDQKAAMLWFYNQDLVKNIYEKGDGPFDTLNVHPHNAVLSFVNWPVGMKEKNPGDVLPHAYRDTKYGFYAWRNRWQDKDDTMISILTGLWYQDSGISIISQGKRIIWGDFVWGNEKDPHKGLKFTDDWAPAKDGSSIMMLNNGSCLAIDFSRASGADVMLVMTGPTVPTGPDTVTVAVGGKELAFLLLGKETPTPKVVDDKVVVGKQTVSIKDGKLVLAVFGGN